MAFERTPPPPKEPPITFGRVPPHDTAAEAAVVSACLLEPHLLTTVRAVLEEGAEAFYSDQHRLIFRAMVDLADRQEPIDVVTVKHWLADRELLARAGGPQYLGDVVDNTPAVANVETHALIVADMRQRRRLMAECQRVYGEGYGEISPEWFSESVEAISSLSSTASVSGWTVLDSDEIFADLEAVPYVVEALDIAPGPPTMLAGYGYSKKTLSAQSLGMAVAGGVELWGRWPVRRGAVVHIDYEQGSRLTRERYQRLARGLDLDREELRGQLRLVSLPATYLDSPNAEAVFTRQLEGHTLAIIDSLRAAAPTSDENDSSARKALDMLARASEATGCTCIVIHHARKPQINAQGGSKMTIRGSAALFDACQAVLVLGAEDGREPSHVTHEKARITGQTVAPFVLRVEDIEGRWGIRIVAEDADELEERTAATELDELCDHVLATIRRHPGMGTRTICQLTKRRNAKVSAAIQLLEADGAIRNLQGSKGGTRWHAHAGGGSERGAGV